MSLSKIVRTRQVDLAWHQGDTAATFEAGTVDDIGVPRPTNPYHPSLAPTSFQAWQRGFLGHPLDERGGFVEAQAEAASA